GGALAIWDRSDGSNNIVQSSYRPAGGAFGTPVDLSGTGRPAAQPQVAFDASGNALAIWDRLNFSNNQIVQAAFGASALGIPPSTQTLSVSKAGSGSGSVTSQPSGISCGAT